MLKLSESVHQGSRNQYHIAFHQLSSSPQLKLTIYLYQTISDKPLCLLAILNDVDELEKLS